ncbi:MAG TPA: hypothetical protein VF523_12785, partial [Burkholderiales bacterium]
MNGKRSSSTNVMSGTTIAAAAATLFLSGLAGFSFANAEETKVHCAGVNACKGKSECSSAKNGCKGQNACRGEGWLSMAEKQC